MHFFRKLPLCFLYLIHLTINTAILCVTQAGSLSRSFSNPRERSSEHSSALPSTVSVQKRYLCPLRYQNISVLLSCVFRNHVHIMEMRRCMLSLLLYLSNLPIQLFLVLYACVGVRAAPVLTPAPSATTSKRAGTSDQAAAAAAGAGAGAGAQPYTASGDWVIARCPLTEAQRRHLLHLSQQHAVWCADTSKFIAKYGDHLSANSDLRETDPTVSSRPSPGITRTPGSGPVIPSNPAYLDGKSSSEAELESRLRSLLSDMEGIVDQVLGQDSECALFLKRRFLPALSVERTGGLWSLIVSA